jgi:hypothetical protein
MSYAGWMRFSLSTLHRLAKIMMAQGANQACFLLNKVGNNRMNLPRLIFPLFDLESKKGHTEHPPRLRRL